MYLNKNKFNNDINKFIKIKFRWCLGGNNDNWEKNRVSVYFY